MILAAAGYQGSDPLAESFFPPDSGSSPATFLKDGEPARTQEPADCPALHKEGAGTARLGRN